MTTEPALIVALLWGVFAGAHVGLATRRVRAAFVARLGEGGFTALFSLIAAASFAVAIRYYAMHRFVGAPGLALGAVPVLRWVLVAAIVTGIVLMVAALAAYPDSPYDLLGETRRGPRGLERVTRHAFFVGTALLGGAHALLATHLTGTVAFGGLALLAILGPWHQDAKLLTRRGPAYGGYLAATSGVPFAAILAGRQRFVWGELPWGALALGLAIAIGLRAVHDGIFAQQGVWVIATVVGGAGMLTLASVRRLRRQARAHAASRGDVEGDERAATEHVQAH
jgi:uncharacterized membrane protein